MQNHLLKYFPYFLFIYHLVFAWFAYDYVNWHNGDAVKYWFIGKNLAQNSWSDYLNPGTDAVFFITFPFVKYLSLKPLWGCFLFSAYSGIGFIRLWNLVKPNLKENRIILGICILLLLLPNVHFWTSLIGKEAILFLPIVVMVEGIFKGKYYSIPMFISFLVLAWIRPHIAFVFLVVWVIAWVWKGKFSTGKKLSLGAIAMLCVAGLYFLLEKVTYSTVPLWTKIQGLYAIHNQQLKGTAAYVPLEEYSYHTKLFTFFFRPFPWEKTGMYYVLIGLEGMIFLVIFLFLIYLFIRNWKSFQWSVFPVFALLCVVGFASMYVYAYANFGMIIRTRALVFPIIFLFSFWVLKEINFNKNIFGYKPKNH